MNVRFSLIGNPSTTYRSEVPDPFNVRGASAGITHRGVSRSLSFYADGRSGGELLSGTRLRGTVVDRDGSVVGVYEQPDPLVHLLVWDLKSGPCWTWSNPDVDGSDGSHRIAASIAVREDDNGWPTADVFDSVARGDIRREGERAAVQFYSRDETDVTGAVSFTHAGSFAADRELFDGSRAVVVRSAGGGLEVACDGPAELVEELRERATSVAATVALN